MSVNTLVEKININAFIGFFLAFIIIVFFISIVLLVYYSVKNKGLIKPIRRSDKNYKPSKKDENPAKSLQINRLPFLGEGIMLDSKNMPKNITIEIDTTGNIRANPLKLRELKPKPVRMKDIAKNKHTSKFSFNERGTI